MKDIDLFTDGKTYATSIRDRRTALMLKENLVRHGIESMKSIEGHLLRVINAELDANSKKVYSNENLRQTELRSRLETHEPYQDSKKLVTISKQEIDEAKIEIDYFKHMLRLVIAFLN